MRIEVRTANTSNPRPYRDRVYAEQQAALHDGGDFPLPIKLNVEEGSAYAPGWYTFAPGCVVTDTHGNPQLKRVRLVPLADKAAK